MILLLFSKAIFFISLLFKPVLRKAIFWLVLFNAKISNFKGYHCVLEYERQETNRKLYWSCKLCPLPQGGGFLKGNPFCDPDWTPGAFSLLKHFRTVMWLCKRRMNLLALRANHKPQQKFSPDNFQFSMLDKNLHFLSRLTNISAPRYCFLFPWVPACPHCLLLWGRQSDVLELGTFESHRLGLGPEPATYCPCELG